METFFRGNADASLVADLFMLLVSIPEKSCISYDITWVVILFQMVIYVSSLY